MKGERRKIERQRALNLIREKGGREREGGEERLCAIIRAE